MTTKYDPYENAIAEHINGTLKQEFEIYSTKSNPNETIKIVRNSINIYNIMRPHLSCELLTLYKAHMIGIFKYEKWGNTR